MTNKTKHKETEIKLYSQKIIQIAGANKKILSSFVQEKKIEACTHGQTKQVSTSI